MLPHVPASTPQCRWYADSGALATLLRVPVVLPPGLPVPGCCLSSDTKVTSGRCVWHLTVWIWCPMHRTAAGTSAALLHHTNNSYLAFTFTCWLQYVASGIFNDAGAADQQQRLARLWQDMASSIAEKTPFLRELTGRCTHLTAHSNYPDAYSDSTKCASRVAAVHNPICCEHHRHRTATAFLQCAYVRRTVPE